MSLSLNAQSLSNRRLITISKNSDASYTVQAWVDTVGGGTSFQYTSIGDKLLCTNVNAASMSGNSGESNYVELWFNTDNTLQRALFVQSNTNQRQPKIASDFSAGQLTTISTLRLDVIANVDPSTLIGYFVSNAGNDSNDGLTTSTPWATLTKVTNTTFTAGANIYFNRGDTFHGSLSLKGASKSGTSISNITFNAYGTGELPIITGFTNVTSWSNVNGNLWASSGAISSLGTCGMVTMNGTNYARGRTPNGNIQFAIDSSSANAITSSSITSATNYVGGEVVIFDSLFTLAKRTITNQYVNTIAYSGTDVSLATDYGFFIQESTNCLDSAHEWVLEADNKLYVYSVGSPSETIKAGNVSTLIDLLSNDFISFKNLHLTGSSGTAYFNNSGDTNTIDSCVIDFNGSSAINTILGNLARTITISNCIISNNNNCGILMSATGGSGGMINSLIQNNAISYSGMFPGHLSGSSSGYAQGIRAVGEKTIIDHNTIDQSGGTGISFFGTNSIVKYNYVNHSNQRMADGAGIYTWNSSSSGPILGCTNMFVTSNIVINCGPCTIEPATPYNLCVGIYLDGNTSGANVQYNSIAHVGRGFHGNFPHDSIFANNNIYDTVDYGIYLDFKNNSSTLDHASFFKNIVVVTNTTQEAYRLDSPESMPTTFASDTNYFGRPASISGSSSTNMFMSNNVHMSLVRFRTQFNRDLLSGGVPANSVATAADVLFYFNPTDTNQTYALPYTSVDMSNNVYTSTLTIPPWGSKTLLKQ